MAQRTKDMNLLKPPYEKYRFRFTDHLRSTASHERLTSLAMSVIERCPLQDENYGILISYFVRKYVE
jgi:hypothetical protein